MVLPVLFRCLKNLDFNKINKIYVRSNLIQDQNVI